MTNLEVPQYHEAPIEKELVELKEEIMPQTFVTNLFGNDPQYFRAPNIIKNINTIDFSNTNVINLVGQIPKNGRFSVLFTASNIKSELWLSDEESIQRALHWETVSSIRLELSKWWNESGFGVDYFYIMTLANEAIVEWKDPFEWLIIPDNIKFGNEDISKNINNKNNVLIIDDLPEDIKSKVLRWIRNKYLELLKSSISDSIFENSEISPISLFNDDEIFGFYLKYRNVWLLQKGSNPLDYQSLSEEDRQKLQNWFNSILKNFFWFEVSSVDEDIRKEFEENERLVREENQRILEEYKKKNEELNARTQLDESEEIVSNESIDSNPSEKKLVEDASWLEIAEDNWLWKLLVEQYNSEYLEESQYDEQAISIAWSKFINTHKELQSIITEEIFLELYNASSNTIKNFDDEARDWLKEIFKDQPEELENLYKQISSLPSIITETKEELHKNSDFAKAVQNENNNNVALGSVIDNVKNIFSNISWKIEWDLWNKWFKFNDNDPAKIQWDNLMISWDFNWAEVLVRYNLKSWEIFMNSFLQFQEDSKKIILWNDEVANYKVWQLESFDNMLSNHESLNSQVNLLSNAIVESSKKQSAINSIVVKFMKTFNVIADPQNIENIEINNWSDLFDFLEIISNSNPNDLEIFQTAMRKLMEYSWLDRGKDNSDGPQENDKTDVENEYASTLRDSIKVFTENPGIFKDKTNFESSYKFWFLQMVIENFKKDGIGKPNRELDGVKINEFMYNLENLGRVS